MTCTSVNIDNTDFTRKYEIRLKHPNPLFEKWLMQWYTDAAAKNLDVQYTFKKALQSLRKFPLTIRSGKECIILEHFGRDLCLKLDQTLVEYQRLNPGATPYGTPTSVKAVIRVKNHKRELTLPLSSKQSSNDGSFSQTISPHKRKSGRRVFVPAKGTGSYALLLTLHHNHCLFGPDAKMGKQELIEKAQLMCDVSLTRALPGSHYSAWSSMGVLCRKLLAVKIGWPPKYMLTDAGKNLAEKLKNPVDVTNFRDGSNHMKHSYSERVNLSDYSISQKGSLRDSRKYKKESNGMLLANVHTLSSSDDDQVDEQKNIKSAKAAPLLLSGHLNVTEAYNPISSQSCKETSQTCTILNTNETLTMQYPHVNLILLIDSCETNGKIGAEATMHKLVEMGTLCEVRHLTVGDYMWVCRDRSGNELVLPIVIERKRIDDLAKSIKDGRFHEQKFRLKCTQAKQHIYIIEGHGKAHTALPMANLMQAASNTHLVDGFIVKHTSSYVHTLKYLSTLYRVFHRLLHDKVLLKCETNAIPQFDWKKDRLELQTFKDFMKNTSKKRKFTVEEMFVRHLLQLHGLSVEKAKAIVDVFPCPRALMDRYRLGADKDLLKTIKVGQLERSIGPIISKTIHELYTKDKFS